jgi:hypothetical protein
MNLTQLDLFDPPQSTQSIDRSAAPADHASPSEIFSPGDRIRIVQAGKPIEHLNGRLGEVLSVRQGLASVQVEGVATAMLLRTEAIERYNEVSQFMDNEVLAVEVGSVVDCDYAFVGKIGTVRRIEVYCGTLVAWVDYGAGVPLYPAGVDSLSLA